MYVKAHAPSALAMAPCVVPLSTEGPPDWRCADPDPRRTAGDQRSGTRDRQEMPGDARCLGGVGPRAHPELRSEQDDSPSASPT